MMKMNCCDYFLRDTINISTVVISQDKVKILINDAWNQLLQQYPLLSSKITDNEVHFVDTQQNQAFNSQFTLVHPNLAQSMSDQAAPIIIEQMGVNNKNPTDFSRLLYQKLDKKFVICFAANHCFTDATTQILLFNELLRYVAGIQLLKHHHVDITQKAEFKILDKFEKLQVNAAVFERALLPLDQQRKSSETAYYTLSNSKFNKLLENKTCLQAIFYACDYFARKQLFKLSEGTAVFGCVISRRNDVHEPQGLGNILELMHIPAEVGTQNIQQLAATLHQEMKKYLPVDHQAHQHQRQFFYKRGVEPFTFGITSFVSNLGKHITLGIAEAPALDATFKVDYWDNNSKNRFALFCFKFSEGFRFCIDYSNDAKLEDVESYIDFFGKQLESFL